MKRFILPVAKIAESIIQPTGNDIAACVEETNDIATIEIDPLTRDIIAICDNKPKDMPVYNIYWHEEPIQ